MEQRAAGRMALGKVQDTVARPVSGNLDMLARIFGTDKSSDGHAYTRHYARHLPARRHVTSLLEIGVGGATSLSGGQSLRMWQRYFPHAQIVGIDLYQKLVRGPRITVEQGSQADVMFLGLVAAKHGPFDVIIDDGSHIGRHVETSFRCLFDHVKPGGWYVIEDLAAAYDPKWEGGTPGQPGTQVHLTKSLVDDVLRRHWSGRVAVAIGAMHVYDEIVFLQKDA